MIQCDKCLEDYTDSEASELGNRCPCGGRISMDTLDEELIDDDEEEEEYIPFDEGEDSSFVLDDDMEF